MINKLKFNNLVISNKGKIRQGRVQTINKIVQKIRKFKQQLEKHSDNEKTQNRLRKMTQSLEHLKILKCFEIIKKILILDKDPSAILTNGLSSPEEIAIAWLASNKIIQDLIKLIKSELSLQDSESQWKQELTEISKRRAKINRTELKKQKRKELKEQKEIERKRIEWIKENNPQANSPIKDVSDDAKISTVDGWKVETLNEDKVTKSASKRKTNPNDSKKIKTEKINGTESDVVTKNAPKRKTNTRNDSKKIKIEKIIKTENDLEAKVDNSQTQKKQENSSNVASRKTETIDEIKEEPSEPVITHIVDPFFITETGDSYLSTAVINRQQESIPETGDKHFRTNGKHNMQSFEAEDNGPRFDNYRKQTNKLNYKNKTENSTGQNNLHPSWEAKQKLKPIISGFQGKKITFEDNGEIKSVKNAKNNLQSAQSTIENNTSNSESNNLHPSWAAKQKLKPIISPFQGKKITFE